VACVPTNPPETHCAQYRTIWTLFLWETKNRIVLWIFDLHICRSGLHWIDKSAECVRVIDRERDTYYRREGWWKSRQKSPHELWVSLTNSGGKLRSLRDWRTCKSAASQWTSAGQTESTVILRPLRPDKAPSPLKGQSEWSALKRSHTRWKELSRPSRPQDPICADLRSYVMIYWSVRPYVFLGASHSNRSLR